MASGLFKIALVFASLVATIELSDAHKDNITDGSGVLKYHPWDKLWGPEQVHPEQEQVDQQDLEISGYFERKKNSRNKRYGNSFYAKYGNRDRKWISASEDPYYGCATPPCSCVGCFFK